MTMSKKVSRSDEVLKCLLFICVFFLLHRFVSFCHSHHTSLCPTAVIFGRLLFVLHESWDVYFCTCMLCSLLLSLSSDFLNNIVSVGLQCVAYHSTPNVDNVDACLFFNIASNTRRIVGPIPRSANFGHAFCLSYRFAIFAFGSWLTNWLQWCTFNLSLTRRHGGYRSGFLNFCASFAETIDSVVRCFVLFNVWWSSDVFCVGVTDTSFTLCSGFFLQLQLFVGYCIYNWHRMSECIFNYLKEIESMRRQCNIRFANLRCWSKTTWWLWHATKALIWLRFN